MFDAFIKEMEKKRLTISDVSHCLDWRPERRNQTYRHGYKRPQFHILHLHLHTPWNCTRFGYYETTKPCHLRTSNLTKIWSELPFRCLLASTETSRTKNQFPAKYAEESPSQDRITAVLFQSQHFFNQNNNFKNWVFRPLSRNGTRLSCRLTQRSFTTQFLHSNFQLRSIVFLPLLGSYAIHEYCVKKRMRKSWSRL